MPLECGIRGCRRDRFSSIMYIVIFMGKSKLTAEKSLGGSYIMAYGYCNDCGFEGKLTKNNHCPDCNSDDIEFIEDDPSLGDGEEVKDIETPEEDDLADDFDDGDLNYDVVDELEFEEDFEDDFLDEDLPEEDDDEDQDKGKGKSKDIDDDDSEDDTGDDSVKKPLSKDKKKKKVN